MGMMGQHPRHEERRDGQAAAQADGPGRRAGCPGSRGCRAWADSRDARHGHARAWASPGWGCPAWACRAWAAPRREHDQDEAPVDGREERQEGRSASARRKPGRRAGAEPVCDRRSTRRRGVDKRPPCAFPADCWRSSLARRRLSAASAGARALSSEDKERLKPYILDAPPADIPHKLDVNFENKVHLIGYKFEPETAQARRRR